MSSGTERSLPRCPICELEVLGLQGQDVVLDTSLLADDALDTEVVELGIFGECHLRCLIESPWGALWASRWLANFTAVRGWPAVTAGDLNVLRNSRLRDTTIVRDDGWLASVTDDAFARREEALDGHLVPVRHELNLPLGAHPDLGRSINATLAAGEAFPLVDVVSALGLGDRLWSPQALSSGSLKPSGVPVSGHDHVTANAEYAMFLPRDVTELLLSTALGR